MLATVVSGLAPTARTQQPILVAVVEVLVTLVAVMAVKV